MPDKLSILGRGMVAERTGRHQREEKCGHNGGSSRIKAMSWVEVQEQGHHSAAETLRKLPVSV